MIGTRTTLTVLPDAAIRPTSEGKRTSLISEYSLSAEKEDDQRSCQVWHFNYEYPRNNS